MRHFEAKSFQPTPHYKYFSVQHELSNERTDKSNAHTHQKKKKKTVGGFPYSFLTSKSKVNNHAASTQTNMEGRSNRWLPENHFGGPGPLTAYVNLRFVYAAFLSTVFVWPECFLLPLAGGFLLCPWRFLYLKQYNLGSRRWRRN